LENMSDKLELNHDLIDLDWGDEGVVPPVIHPDTMFIFTEMARVILDMVEPGDGDLVVDVGCGRGVDVMEMARRGMNAIGLDPSSRMVAGAKEYLGSNVEYLRPDNNSGAAVVRGLGEALPFRERSLDKLICKGSLDHFADMERTMADMSRVLKPGGAAIIAVANFNSLSCRLGRAWHPISLKVYRVQTDRHPWQPPDDHNYEFNSPFLKQTVKNDFEIKKIRGLSLLWTAPYWGKVLSLLPGWGSAAVLRILDWGARLFPSLSDVLIIKLTPKG
jgi:ubiquinone/menaquinone biosynthesis C-methylase UbiE